MPIIAYVLIALFVLGLGGGIVYTYNSAIEDREEAEQLAAQERARAEQYESALMEQRLAVTIEKYEKEQLEKKFEESQKEVEKLETIFQEHNFDELYDKKPGLILKRVNDGTQRVFSDVADTINETGRAAETSED